MTRSIKKRVTHFIAAYIAHHGIFKADTKEILKELYDLAYLCEIEDNKIFQQLKEKYKGISL